MVKMAIVMMVKMILSHILMCSTRLLCLVVSMVRIICIIIIIVIICIICILMCNTRLCWKVWMVKMILKAVTHLSIMAMTAETFNSMAFSIASMASAFATGNFKSRSPS